MTGLDKIQIIAQGFLKIAINFWPLTIVLISIITIGSIQEWKESKQNHRHE
jgi:hypothetical protein